MACKIYEEDSDYNLPWFGVYDKANYRQFSCSFSILYSAHVSSALDNWYKYILMLCFFSSASNVNVNIKLIMGCIQGGFKICKITGLRKLRGLLQGGVFRVL